MTFSRIVSLPGWLCEGIERAFAAAKAPASVKVKGAALRELGSRALSDGELHAMGKIVINFADLDFAAGHLLEGFIGGEVATVLVAGEDIRWKLDKLAVITDEIVSDERAAQSLRDWMRTSRRLIDRRNQLMHSFYITAGGEEATRRWKASTREGKWKGQTETIALAELGEFADLLAEGWAAAKHVEEQLRACPQWHDHP